MKLTPGARFRSTVCETEVVVVRAGVDDVELCCGRAPMSPQPSMTPATGSPSAGFDEGSALGKRYCREDLGLEVLVTKAGIGTLSIGVEPIPVKDPKPLPSSD